MKEESLIKDATQAKASTWRKHVIDLAKELHIIYDQMAILSKEVLKHHIQKEIETKILEEIDNEAEIKTTTGEKEKGKSRSEQDKNIWTN